MEPRSSAATYQVLARLSNIKALGHRPAEGGIGSEIDALSSAIEAISSAPEASAVDESRQGFRPELLKEVLSRMVRTDRFLSRPERLRRQRRRQA